MNNSKLPYTWIHRLQLRFSEIWPHDKNPICDENLQAWCEKLSGTTAEAIRAALLICCDLPQPPSQQEFANLCFKAITDSQDIDTLYRHTQRSDVVSNDEIGGSKLILERQRDPKIGYLEKLAQISDIDSMKLPLDDQYERICYLREKDGYEFIKNQQKK